VKSQGKVREFYLSVVLATLNHIVVNIRIRGLFDKFVELCNKSVNFEYFFLKFGHVIYLPDVNTVFEFQSSYTLTSLNIGYHSNLCVASCRAPFFYRNNHSFLAHLSTKCSWWAIVVSGLSVVRRASTFDVYTLETTFVIRFLWNLVRMFVLTISIPSSNMGHVG